MKNIALMAAGFALLGVGALGAVLPVLPTTPFVLASAVCFTTGNPRIARWLTASPFFGSFIRNYREKTGVPARTKAVAIAVLWGGLALSMFLAQKPLLYGILPVVGVCVTIHICLLKTAKEKRADADRATD